MMLNDTAANLGPFHSSLHAAIRNSCSFLHMRIDAWLKFQNEAI